MKLLLHLELCKAILSVRLWLQSAAHATYATTKKRQVQQWVPKLSGRKPSKMQI